MRKRRIVGASLIIFAGLLLLAVSLLNFGREASKSDTKLQQKTLVKSKPENKTGAKPSGSSVKILDASSHLPVFSITTDPEHLWSEDKGIYVRGQSASRKYPYKGANYWQDWAIPVDIDYFETGKSSFKTKAELKIFGGETRTLPQKSFALYAKQKYGSKTFEYPFFPEKNLSGYKTFVLRNGGQDFNKTHILDGMVSILVQGTNIDDQSYRPVVVYLNGDYWGIYDLREKIDVAYLAANHIGVKKKDIDLLEANAIVKEGSSQDYLDLIDFIKTHDLAIAKNYDEVTKKVDIENFIDYIMSQLYIANTDWPSHNYRYWKAKGDFTKWRWIIYDSDLSFGDYQDHTVERLINYKGNGDDSLYISFLFRELMKNKQFRADFKQRSDYLLSNTFQPDRVIETINTIRKQVEPEMPNHLKKWGGTIVDWEQNINNLIDFAQKRTQYLKQDLNRLYTTYH
jgi:hypothetical protein